MDGNPNVPGGPIRRREADVHAVSPEVAAARGLVRQLSIFEEGRYVYNMNSQ
jgi:hypothetical protein